MRIVFAGTPEIAVPTLQALLASEHEVVGVITRPAAPLGRKKVLTPSPVAAEATAAGVPLLETTVLDAAATAWVQQLQADVGVIVAYGALVRETLLATLQLGWLNLHFSALPAWRGAAPVQRALLAGETTLGMDVFRLVQELDAGAIVSRGSYQVTSGQSAGEVLAAMAQQGQTLVLQALAELAVNPAAGTPQQGEPSYAHKLQRELGRLDFNAPHTTVLAQWAGVTPEPGAYAELADGSAVKILRLAPLEAAAAEQFRNSLAVPPGTAALYQKQALIACGSGVLRLLQVQPAGKKAMAATDWLRGRGGKTVFNDC